jgi:chorismate mutase
MSTETIEEVKARISELDRRIVELQSARFTASMRLSVLLAQAAKASATPEPGKQLSTWFDEKYEPGVTGFEREI